MRPRRLRVGADVVELAAEYRDGRLRFETEEGAREVRAVALAPGEWLLREEDGRTHTLQVARRRTRWWVHCDGRTWCFEEAVGGAAGAAAAGSLVAPMNGKVEEVLVAEGESVAAGQPLVTLSAMKMQIEVKAPYDGVVERLFHAEGDQIEGGDRVAVVAPAEGGE